MAVLQRPANPGGGTMTPRYYNRVDNGNQSRPTHLIRSRKRQPASQPMPELPGPFKVKGDCHYTLTFDDITATLFYSRAEGLWSVTFDRPGIVVGSYNQFDRDTPALEMQTKIILAIMARPAKDDDWLTENLPTGEPQSDDAPGCYGLARGVDY